MEEEKMESPQMTTRPYSGALSQVKIQLLYELSLIYNEPFSHDKLTAYLLALDRVTDKGMQKAYNSFIADSSRKFFPKPGEILEASGGSRIYANAKEGEQ
jgi:hypothetical protein